MTSPPRADRADRAAIRTPAAEVNARIRDLMRQPPGPARADEYARLLRLWADVTHAGGAALRTDPRVHPARLSRQAGRSPMHHSSTV